MKIIIVECRKINHTPFKHFDNCWSFYQAFASIEMAKQVIEGLTGIGCMFYGTLEFRISERTVIECIIY